MSTVNKSHTRSQEADENLQMSFESRHFFYLAGNSLNIIISQAIDVAARLTNYAEWMDSNANFERARAMGQQRGREGDRETGEGLNSFKQHRNETKFRSSFGLSRSEVERQ